MRFKGQVKIPQLDSPGVPAVILIEDPQTELFVEGESLGRWSLADVRAERLIASAFSLDLGGDEVTFIADDPINFAYGGVDEMAKVWARYKTMTMPRRMVATSRSRKGTKPSRIGDLRSAIEETLAAPTSKPVASPPAQVEEPVVPVAPPVETEAVALIDTTESGPTAELEAVDQVDRETLQHAADESAPADELLEPIPPHVAPRPSNQESVYKDAVPWAGQAESERAGSDAVDEVEPVLATEQALADGQPAIATPAIVADEAADGSIPDSEPEREMDEETLPASEDQSVPWLEPAAAAPSETPQPFAPPAVAAGESPPAPEPPRYVVDLGAFEHSERAVARVEPAQPEDPDEMALEPAMAGTGERGGIMGAVRSAFVRNRDVHEHEYVAAPGGIGIVRNICAHCGHISIGVSE